MWLCHLVVWVCPEGTGQTNTGSIRCRPGVSLKFDTSTGKRNTKLFCCHLQHYDGVVAPALTRSFKDTSPMSKLAGLTVV